MKYREFQRCSESLLPCSLIFQLSTRDERQQTVKRDRKPALIALKAFGHDLYALLRLRSSISACFVIVLASKFQQSRRFRNDSRWEAVGFCYPAFLSRFFAFALP